MSFSPNNVNGRGGTNRRAKARRRAKNAIGRHRLGDRKSCLGDRKSCNAYSVAQNACPSPPLRSPFSAREHRNFNRINRRIPFLPDFANKQHKPTAPCLRYFRPAHCTLVFLTGVLPSGKRSCRPYHTPLQHGRAISTTSTSVT